MREWLHGLVIVKASGEISNVIFVFLSNLNVNGIIEKVCILVRANIKIYFKQRKVKQ